MKHYEVIGKNGKVIETDVTLHPGEVLTDELEARKILKKDFAALLDLQPSHLSDLLKGKRHVSARLALKLEQHFKSMPCFGFAFNGLRCFYG